MLTRLTKIIYCLLTLGAIGGNAMAEENDQWQEGDFSKARLVANFLTSPGEDEGVLYLGWHVKLEPGWKTYWRSPGSAGLPPQFDWQGSKNIADIQILYPSPERFKIFNLHTYGYHDDVVYPILVTPEIKGEPILIKATVNYLVCNDLCVPVLASYELEIPASQGSAVAASEAKLINRFLAMVPSKVSRSGGAIQFLDYKIFGAPGAENIVVHIKASGLLSGADIIMEDKPGFKFGIPKKRLMADLTEAEFIIPVYASGENDSLFGNEVVVIITDGWDNFEERRLEFNNSSERN